MIGTIRSLVPRWDRRSSSRFRDVRVVDAINDSERRIAENDTLRTELDAIYEALPKKDSKPSGHPR
jgi:hypothetical protein